ncbi:hypothetical protein [Microbacterium sp.]|uniref:hypothetical protein n=1 Tax=Microbacterium sp. TaxID=51671 RepID=UPI003A9057C6
MTIPTPLTPIAHHEHTPVPRRRGWWRTNALALTALLVLVPAIGVGVWWNEWNAYYGFGARKVAAVQVPKDGTVELGGATWGPLKAGEAKDTSSMNLPSGTRFVIAIVPVAPDGKSVSCEAPLLIQQSTGREWSPLRTEVGIPFSDDEPDHCVNDLADPDDKTSVKPYSIVVGFVVPEDVTGPFWLDVDPFGDDRFVRFSLNP